jgi:hypothetical protein
MATVTSPLLSISARGQIGKSVVFSNWKGIKTAKQYVIPANPQTTKQVAQRDLFRWVHDAYKYLPANVQAPWIEYAKGIAQTPANAWMSANNVALKGATDVADIIFTKPVRSGPPPASSVATAGSGTITVLGTPSGLITGWTITKFIAIAMKNVDPSGEMEMILSQSGEVDTSPYSVVITGLAHAQPYVCGGFFQYLRPDGMVAYGSAINETVTTT